MKKIFRSIKIIYWNLKAFFARYYFGNPARKLKIVGVTGTSGKTTNVTLLYRITRELGFKAGLISTVENLINDEKVSIDDDSDRPGTTPDAIYLNKIFKKMVKMGCEYVFMEVSSHSADQKRVAGIPFVGGIFVNLSQDHLDYHKNMEDYFQAKKKFFKILPRRAFALSNIDDKYGMRMLENIKANSFTYGFNKTQVGLMASHKSDLCPLFHGEIKKIDFTGLELSFNKINIKSKLLGKFNAYNLLSVWSACSLLNFDMDKVNKIIENIDPPRGRFEHFISNSGVLVVVDYAHKPDALEKIFEAVKEVIPIEGKLVSVFGCGGDRDKTKRPIMGKIGVKYSEIAIFTSDNPRSEDPDKIIEDMKQNLSREELQKVETIPNRLEAIKKAVKISVKGDIILIAGKGHEDYQVIKGVKSHFDDMEELQKAFK